MRVDNRGFSLIEMLVTIAVAAILITAVFGNFRDAARDNRLTAQTNTFVAALQFARSEAISRGMIVTIGRTGAEWNNGWQIFTDSPVIGTVDGTDIVLRVEAAFPNNFTLNENNFPNRISYRSNGRSTQAGSFVICDNSDSNDIPESRTSRMIVIAPSGRVRIAGDDDGDGIPEQTSGGPNITSCVAPF